MSSHAFRPQVEALEDRLALSTSPLRAIPWFGANGIQGLAGLENSLGRTHKDNPVQIPISTPITLLLVAAQLLFVPTVFKVSGATLFGSEGGVAAVAGVQDFGSPPS